MVPQRLRLLSIPLINRLFSFAPRDLKHARRLAIDLGHSDTMAATLTDSVLECIMPFASLPETRRTWLGLLESAFAPDGLRARYRIGSEELRHVRAPVQFVWGEHDPFGSPDLAGRAVVMVPSAILHETPGGHMPWWDEPEQCAAWIRQFHSEVVEEGA